MRGKAAARIVAHPWAFVVRTLKAFRANQGLLLAGAVAYYALLSLVPLMILALMALLHVINPPALLATSGRYLEWLLLGQPKGIIAELTSIPAHRDVIGWVRLIEVPSNGVLRYSNLKRGIERRSRTRDKRCVARSPLGVPG
jgi:hypothetical protein